MLNLADSITSDPEQRKAIKGLMKDFCNDSYYPLLGEIEDFLRYFKVIPEGGGQQGYTDLDPVDNGPR